MRWKIVFLKKPARARDTIDADALGPRLRSRATVKSPQLVLKSSVHFLAASSGFAGFLPFAFGRGAGTFAICWQPVAAGVATEVCVAPPPDGMSAVLELLLDPHPAIVKTRIAAVGTRRRIGAAE